MRPTSSDVQVEWLESLDRIAAIEPEWRELEARVEERLAFGSFDFIYPVYVHQPADRGTPLVGVARRAGALVGVVPLILRSATMGRVPVRRIDTAGHDADIGETLFPREEAPAFAELLESMFRRGGFHVAMFTGILPGSWRHEALLRAARHGGRRHEDFAYQYATVDLANGYDEYFNGLSAKLRGNLRRRRKRAEAVGCMALDRIARTVDRATLDEYMARVFTIYDRSWKMVGQKALQDYHRLLYSDVAHRFNQRGMLDLTILQVGGRDASFLLGLRERNVLHDLTISYDEEFASISPGTLLIQDLAKAAAPEGVRLVISHGDREYKRYWASRWVPQVRTSLFPPGLRPGLARLARFTLPRLADRARGLLRGGAERLPTASKSRRSGSPGPLDNH